MKLKPYPEYKDSGVELVGEIPEGWEAKKLKYSAVISNDKLNKKPNNLSYVGLEHIESWTGKLIGNEIEEVDSSVNLFHKGNILFGKLRPYLAKVIEAHSDGVCTSELVVFKVNKDVNSRFIFHQLLSHRFINIVNALTYGVKMPRANPHQIENMTIYVPPIGEQEKISSFLDKKTAEIDLTIEKDTHLIELLKEKRTALINHVVTKGLDPTVKMKDSGVEWIGEIPEDWEVKKLKHELLLLDHKRIPLSAEVRTDMEKIYDYYGASGVIDKVEKYIFDGKYILLGEDGANLLSRSTPLAFIAEGKFWVNNHAHILDTKNGNMDFFVNLLEIIDYTPQIEGSAQPKLTADNLKNIKILVPTLNEQNQISEFIIHETTHIDKIIYKIQKNIDLLTEYKKSLIHHVVTGKVDVREVAV